jgi:hypothetical protein
MMDGGMMTMAGFADLRHEVETRAGQIVESFGPDVDEALCRYEQAGADTGGAEAKIWVSVAFALGRLRRFSLWSGAEH